MSRWCMQTKSGGADVPLEDRGDCVPACIAAILGLPITEVANCHGAGWWDALQGECLRHGYCLVDMALGQEPPACLWIATVPSLNLPPSPDGKPTLHCVVARSGELVHDPCLAERYDDAQWLDLIRGDGVAGGWVLVPVDPAALELKPS